ncbi:MAG: Calcineurin-like phosphoesterase superfamily domain protein [bacterium ADurb.Bin243]|nr:MAG: Calcineurin-like phosphoesterase superfamily domain protein [bacterium ADurb.Bin243]
MKKIICLFLLTWLGISLGCSSSSTSASMNSMSAYPSVSVSMKAGDPSVNDSTDKITVNFSEQIDPASVSGEVKLYRIKTGGATEEVLCTTSVDNNAPMQLVISRQDGAKLVEGEQYKIVVSGRIKSRTGISMASDFTGYFATNYSFNLGSEGIAALNGERSQIICISDIHLGADLAYSEFDRNGTGNGAALADFLNKVRQSPNVKELVIAGDLLDEWFVPSDVDTYQGKTQADFVARIAAAHKNVIDAFKNIINEKKIKVTYVPGNHDLTITSQAVESILPGISQARDVKGLGTYSPADRQELAFEHGHRYNYFCAPDPISNRSITNTDSIMPPGYFFTRVATTSVVERIKGEAVTKINPPDIKLSSTDASQVMLYYYYLSFKGILAGLPIKEGFNDKIIKTNIDGFTANYALSDIFPYQTQAGGPIDVNLYKGAQDNWDRRQEMNLVPVKIPVKDAITQAAYSTDLDDKSETQYFKNPASTKRIVVFGHSHVPLIKASVNNKSQKTIYANSGTWIDHNPGLSTMHFVVITPKKSTDSTVQFVNLYSYSKNGTITQLPNPQAITDLD